MKPSRQIARAALAAAVALLALGPSTAAQAAPAPAADRAEAVTLDLAVLAASPAQAKPVPVRPGDTLSGIVWRECRTGDWSQAARDNARTNPNPHLIYAGQTLQINCTPGQAAPPQAQATGAWVAPVRACVTSPYGQWRGTYAHQGTDLGAAYGTPIRAATRGYVWTGWNGGAGNYTRITHGGGLVTVYMHQSSFAVRSGWVGVGQVIGYVGSTGDSSGPHLHFEVWRNGGTVDPVAFMAAGGIQLGC